MTLAARILAAQATSLHPSAEEVDAALPRVLPPSWRVVARAEDGVKILSRDGLSIIASLEIHEGRKWIHVSCARRDRLPSWDDLRLVKSTIITDARHAYSVMPTKEEYVNIHNFCLHLFAPLDGERALPDFTRGSGSL